MEGPIAGRSLGLACLVHGCGLRIGSPKNWTWTRPPSLNRRGPNSNLDESARDTAGQCLKEFWVGVAGLGWDYRLRVDATVCPFCHGKKDDGLEPMAICFEPCWGEKEESSGLRSDFAAAIEGGRGRNDRGLDFPKSWKEHWKHNLRIRSPGKSKGLINLHTEN